MTKRLRFLTFSKHLIRQLRGSSIFDGAAALSFYFLLATIPALMLALILLSSFSLQDLEQQLLLLLRQAPDDVQKVLRRALREFKEGGQIKAHILSIAAITAAWTVSSGIIAAVRQIDRVHSSKTKRGLLRSRLSSMLLFALLSFVGLLCLLLLVVGRAIQNLNLFSDIPFLNSNLFGALTLLTLFVLIFVSCLTLYKFSTKEKLKRLIPGALFTTLATMVITHLFGLYVKNIAQYSNIYGSLAAVIVMLFWFYLIGFMLILGAEINVAIRKTLR